MGIKRMGLKWASQLITQIWKIIHSQWIHCSKIKHLGEALENTTKNGVHPKMSPKISFYGLYQKPFIYFWNMNDSL